MVFFSLIELTTVHHSGVWWWFGAKQAICHYLNRWWLNEITLYVLFFRCHILSYIDIKMTLVVNPFLREGPVHPTLWLSWRKDDPISLISHGVDIVFSTRRIHDFASHIKWLNLLGINDRNVEFITSLTLNRYIYINMYKHIGTFLTTKHRPTSTWWIQMSWRQTGARPSAATMLTLL